MKGRSVLWKIITAFFIITILPVGVITAFFYPQNYKILNNVMEDELTGSAQRTVEKLDEEFLKIFKAAIDIKTTFFKQVWGEEGSYSYAQQVRELLKTARSNSTLAEEVLLYQPESQHIYSQNGTISQEYFQNILYCFHGANKEDMLSELSSASPSLFYVPSFSYSIYNELNSSPMLVLAYPLSKKMGWALFFLPENKVRGLISGVSGNSHNYLLYGAETIYLSASPTLTQEEMWSTVQKQRAGVEVDSFTSYSCSCKTMKLTYQVFEVNELLYRDLNRLLQTTIAVVLLIVVAGVSAMLVIIRTNYRPLIHILEKISGTPDLPEGAQGGSEYERLQSGISNMQNRNIKLNSTLQAYRENYKSLFLYEFLSGSIQKINDLTDVEERLEIELYHRFLVPVFLEFREDKALADSPILLTVDMLNRRFRSLNQEEIQMVFSACMEKNSIFCLASVRGEPEEFRSGLLEDFLRREVFGLFEMKQAGPFYAIIGKGSDDIYEAKENVQLLYQFLDSALIKNLSNYSVSEVERLQASESSGPLHPFGTIYDLTHAVDSRDVIKVHQVVESIIQVLTSASTSIVVAKMLFGQAMFVFQTANPNFLFPSEPEGEGSELYSTNQMALILREQEQKLSQLFEQETRSVGTHRRDIMAYVNEHFLDQNFSIAAVAEHYHMQISNMSAYFKKCYQITFQQYVSKKKVEKAQSLLVETSLTLEEISQRLGYANASSFSRSFKRVVGITPGEYRER